MPTTDHATTPSSSALIHPSKGAGSRSNTTTTTATTMTMTTAMTTATMAATAAAAIDKADRTDRIDRTDRTDPINRRDENGTTQLHRAVAANQIDVVRRLLDHPKINVNEKDLESGWTALHRALYLGHLRIALLLIQHNDLNMSIEDKDRNTAMDVVLATLPVSLKAGPCPGDSLYTWGSNANFSLGHNDGDDRKLPELVKFPYKTNTITFPRAKAAKSTLYQFSMGKFHTAIATSEPGLTAKLWGFGTNGRLGSDRKMQLRPAPVMGVPGNVIRIALGRDHTVLVTSKGEVFTLGSNKYGQLGYALEIPKGGQDPIQYSPKRVFLNIAKAPVIGAAASKWHTAVYTDTELFTFGFNYGQLGYERKGDIQLGPRKVASIPPGAILQVVASDSATACLMSSNDVIVLHKYAYHRVSFSLSPYPDWFSTFNSPAVASSNRPRKIACTDNKFGMLTALGDVHVWSYPEVESSITLGSLPANHSVPFSSVTGPDKPRRVWISTEDRTHVMDFALGQNGSVIAVTNGGHVYIGTNKGTLVGRNVKWQRVPHLDRIVQVFGNSSGAWAAFRSDSALTPIAVRPPSLGVDLEQSLSQFHLYRNNEKNYGDITDTKLHNNDHDGKDGDYGDGDDDDDDDDDRVDDDPWRISVQGWQDIERSWDHDVVPLLSQTTSLLVDGENSVSGSHLFDVEIQAGKRTLGAHRIMLAARSPVLRRAFVDSPSSRTTIGSLVTIDPTGPEYSAGTLHIVLLKVEFTTAVLLLQFLYSDRFDPFWDFIGSATFNRQYGLKVRQELYHLALELSLPTLQAALQYSFTHACSASLSRNLAGVLTDRIQFHGLADVRLLLKDGATMEAHQIILGHRSPFFSAMFVRTNEWIRARQGKRRLPGKAGERSESIVEVNMRHMDQEAMALVLRHMYTDCGPEMFDESEKDEMDELVELVVDVLRIADEFLMDRLKEICESVLGEQVRAKTAVSFLEISLMYAAKSLTTTCIDFLCHNIEMVLDQRWLEGVEDEVVQLVEEALRKKQEKLQPYTRSGGHLPDPAVVQEMREMIQDEGYHYFRPLGTFQSDPPKTQQRPDSHRTLDQGNPSAPRPLSISLTTSETVTTPPAELPPRLSATPIPSLVVSSLPNRQSALDAAGGLRPLSRAMSSDISSQGSRASPSTKDWPTLSDAPSAELKEIRSMPVRKTSWGQVPTVDPAVHLDDQDISTATSSTHKPTLRDILEQEQEQRNGQASSQTPATAGTPMHKTSKLSQKERRKQLQQQLVSTIQDHDTSASPAQHPHAWAKVGPATTLDLCTVGNEGTVGQVKRSGTMPKSNTPLSSPSLLELQQSELALFRTQPKEVPRVAIATSKPVKETMRASGGGERTFSEAPWRLDAIPEPLRAVTRHQSQMYPRLETSSTNHGQGQGGGSGGSGGGSGSNKAGPGFREHQGSPGTCKSQPLQSGGGSIALSPSMVDVSSSLSGSSGVSPSPSSTMALSSFAIIQNQQLRDRNLLLRARHQKKSLYQIQIEEQALNQLRLLSLERIQAKATEGTGEWFTVGH